MTPSIQIGFGWLDFAYHEPPYLKIFYYFLNFFIVPNTLISDAQERILFAESYSKSIIQANLYQGIDSIYIK